MASKQPLEKKEIRTDLELFKFGRLDHFPETSDISLILRSKNTRTKGLGK